MSGLYAAEDVFPISQKPIKNKPYQNPLFFRNCEVLKKTLSQLNWRAV